MFLHHHLNSSTLQKEHYKIYQDFFSSHSLVVSAPSILLWTPIYSVGYGGLGICTKLPTRHYVGFRKKENNNNNIQLVNFVKQRNYYPEKNIFKERAMLSYYNDWLGKVLDDFLKKKGVKEGVEIEILEEGPVARGWHTTQAVAVATVFGLYLWYNFCRVEEILKWKTTPTENLVNDKKFNEIIKLIWKAVSYTIEAFDDGYAIISASIDSRYPICFYHEKDPNYFDQYKDLGLDNPKSYYNYAEKINWRAVRLDELFKLPPTPEWVLEYAILYIGSECPLRYIYSAQIEYDERLSHLASFIARTFSKTVPKNFQEIPHFLAPCFAKNESPGMVLFKKYREAAVVLSSEFVKHFYELYHTGYVFSRIQEFFKGINLCETLAKVLGQVTAPVDDVCSILTRIGRKITNLGVGAKLISEGVTGDILLVTPYNTAEKIIEKAQKEVEELIGQPLYCEYASWCDGYESEGIKIEQHLAENIYSSFISPHTLILSRLKENGEVAVSLISQEELTRRLPEFDLLGDLEAKKIYIQGRLLSSSDIHSAKTTLAILETFFHQKRTKLQAKELPPMSYRDRNQMESKIIRPLVSVFKKYTYKNLKFFATGSLGSNFSLVLKPEGIKIALVSKK